MSYKTELGIATSLYCIKPSLEGGETHFVDLVKGYELLKNNQEIMDMINELNSSNMTDIRVRHLFGNRRALANKTLPYQQLTLAQQQKIDETIHRLVEKHPVTGEESLFAIAGTAHIIEGLNEAVSMRLLDQLEDYVITHSFYYRHHYEVGDVVIWDNMTTLHTGYNIKPSRSFKDCRLLYRMNVNYREALL